MIKSSELTPKEKFGIFVRQRREELGITLRGLCRSIELSPTYLSKIEQGEFLPPSEEKVKLLARYLRVDEDKLMGLADRIPSDFKEIFTHQPKPVADFLRTAKGLSDKDWGKLRKQASELKKERI